MTPTKEQLADPDFWKLHAPEGAYFAWIHECGSDVVWSESATNGCDWWGASGQLITDFKPNYWRFLGQRPIRTQAEIEREEVVDKAESIYVTFDGNDSLSPREFAEKLYDAGMLRKPISREEAVERLRGRTTLYDEQIGSALNALGFGYKD